MIFKFIFRACLTSAVGLLLVSAAGSQPAPTAATAPIAPTAHVAANDFHVILLNHSVDSQKYLTYGWNGWSGRTVRWRYNDANRPSAMVPSTSAAVSRLQSAMGKWSAACNVQFVYDGTTNAIKIGRAHV